MNRATLDSYTPVGMYFDLRDSLFAGLFLWSLSF
jgi:hypothetical protein